MRYETWMSSIVNLLTKFTGRIGRQQWWLGFVIVCAGNLLGGLLLNPDFFFADERPPKSWPDTIWQIALLFPMTAITVKRFNGRDWPWWLGYVFAPLAAARYLGPHVSPWISPVAPTQPTVPIGADPLALKEQPA